MVEKLRKLSELGVSHTQMAQEIGVSKTAVNSWVSGLKKISIGNEDKVRKYLQSFKERINLYL